MMSSSNATCICLTTSVYNFCLFDDVNYFLFRIVVLVLLLGGSERHLPSLVIVDGHVGVGADASLGVGAGRRDLLGLQVPDL